MTLTQRDYLQMARPQPESATRTRLHNVLYSIAASAVIFVVLTISYYLLLELILNVGFDDDDIEGFYRTLLFWLSGGFLIVTLLWILLSLLAGYMIFKSNLGSDGSRCPNCQKMLDDAQNCVACDYRFSEHARALYEQDIQRRDVQEKPERS